MTMQHNDQDVLQMLKDAWIADMPYNPGLSQRIISTCTPARINVQASNDALSWPMAGAIAASLLIGLYAGTLTDRAGDSPSHVQIMQKYVLAQGGAW